MMAPTVHIIDDDKSFRTALGRLVETYGFGTNCYESGEDFLLRLPDSKAGCILLDLRMPGLSGPELQERLTDAAPLLPIVFLTGQGTIAAGVQAMKAGAEDFLEKPVSSKTLRGVIDHALAQNEKRRAGHDMMQSLRAKVSSLTPRESQVFDGVVRGKRNKQIAFDLDTSERTVKAHRHSIMEKLGATSLAEMVSLAERLGRIAPNRVAETLPSEASPKANIQRR
jgi:FixJ family two-component response regulator